MDVAGVTAEHEHASLVHHGRMMVSGTRDNDEQKILPLLHNKTVGRENPIGQKSGIPGRRWVASSERSAPRFVLAVKAKEVVQHRFAIVTTEDVDGVLVRDDGVFAPSRPDEFVALGHAAPFVHRFKWSKIKSQAFRALRPIQVKVRASRTCYRHQDFFVFSV